MHLIHRCSLLTSAVAVFVTLPVGQPHEWRHGNFQEPKVRKTVFKKCVLEAQWSSG